MHISGLPLDLYSFLQFLFTAFLFCIGLLYLVKNTASKYFFVDATFDEGGGGVVLTGEERRRSREDMLSVAGVDDCCASCGDSATKKCSGCKAVRYCSQICQSKHWKGGHNLECKEFKRGNLNSTSIFSQRGRNFGCGGTSSTVRQLSKKIIFPYEEFVKLFIWDKPGFPPCGLLNCGNSCFANVVLQCLSCTRPLVAYLLEKGHREECRRNDWCFLCELQIHVERAIQSSHPFSPINILSRLPNIGGNLGYGKQEDAHEFMRFAIDTMQSVCLDEFGGEKALHPSSLETTLIQHIFGGHLQSQVTCTECNKISNRYENMMDLTVEIQGDAASLEDCLDQFTVKEWLDGDNMYKCDGCNDYVKAWKRLTVCQAPNVLTIALKRFQSGRFGKLNKRVTFPETLDLGPYMSEAGEGTDLYRLYAVVVHVDMLNASFFGHYICYTKDFDGNWYRIDDCKVTSVELDEVLAQGAYMLLYSRNTVRSHCVKPLKPSTEEYRQPVEVAEEAQECLPKPVVSFDIAESMDLVETSTSTAYDISQHAEESGSKNDSLDNMDLEDPFKVNLRPPREIPQDMDTSNNSHDCDNEHSCTAEIISASSSKGTLPIELEFPETNSDAECSSRVGNGEMNGCNTEYMSSKSSVDSYLSGQNGIYEMAETSAIPVVELTSTRETVGGENSASFPRLLNSRLENLVAVKSGMGSISAQGIEVKTTKSTGDKNTCSGEKPKPLFSRGFLDKSTRYRSLNGNGKAQMESSEAGPSYKVNSNCNGFVRKPDFLHQNSSEYNDHDRLDCDSLLKSSFIEKKSEKFLGEDEVANGGCNSSESSHGAELGFHAELVHREVPISASLEETPIN